MRFHVSLINNKVFFYLSRYYHMAPLNFQYPLSDENKYKARIIFSVHKVTPPSLNTTRIKAAKNSLSSTDNNSVVLTNPVGNPNEDRANEEGAAATAAKLARDNAAAGANFANDALTSKLHISNIPMARMKLFLPQQIQINDGVTFENQSLGYVGGVINQAMNSGTGAIPAAMEAIGASIANAFTSFDATSDVAKVGLARLSRGAGDGISSAITNSLQVAPNPNMRAIFSGVNIREPSWTFKMVPESAEEAKQIEMIVQTFREFLYPEEILDTVSGSQVPVGFKFPPIFRAKIMYGKKELEHLRPAVKFLDMYLKGFTHTYNSSGMGFHSDGNFSEVEMTLNFIETRALSRKDVSSGAYGAMLSGFRDDPTYGAV
jgi:hypothetical protein|tara:strand:- start:8054 stop:9178 length:1125 start_codon:yes stop_codon:yes gene_type:complete